MKISILGNGSWGTALAWVLYSNGYEVSIWGRDAQYIEEVQRTRINRRYLKNFVIPKGISFSSSLAKSLSADLLVLATPTAYVSSLFEEIVKIKRTLPLLLNSSKGVDISTLKMMHQIFFDYFPDSSYASLSGPSHAEEVIQSLPTTVVVSSNSLDICRRVQKIFTNQRFFRTYYSLDMIGVELGGSLKNIFAIAAGAIFGLNLGSNAQAALLTRSLVEMKNIGRALGAEEKTFNGLSGIGDLIVTCVSEFSRNRKFGILLASEKNRSLIKEKMGSFVAEGVFTTKSAYLLSQKHSLETPIIDQVYQVIYEDKLVRQSMLDLMARQAKAE